MGEHYIPASVRLVVGLCAARVGLRSLLTRRLRRKRTPATEQKLPFPYFPFLSLLCVWFFQINLYLLRWLEICAPLAFFTLLRTKRDFISGPVF
jgi:hypothetical protein